MYNYSPHYNVNLKTFFYRSVKYTEYSFSVVNIVSSKLSGKSPRILLVINIHRLAHVFTKYYCFYQTKHR